mmetsp:Transcript_27629/g.79479  ORF Transcript_27629/g.79479 Transcript_27629/m.79479 type:complete len:259 (+) Transcript_27629:738-1514(+)
MISTGLTAGSSCSLLSFWSAGSSTCLLSGRSSSAMASLSSLSFLPRLCFFFLSFSSFSLSLSLRRLFFPLALRFLRLRRRSSSLDEEDSDEEDSSDDDSLLLLLLSSLLDSLSSDSSLVFLRFFLFFFLSGLVRGERRSASSGCSSGCCTAAAAAAAAGAAAGAVSGLRTSSPHLRMIMGSLGLSLLPASGGICSTASSTSKPSTTRPKTTCFPSRWGHGAKVMKNWLPLVPGPALAMLSRPRLSWLALKFSSGNLPP